MSSFSSSSPTAGTTGYYTAGNTSKNFDTGETNRQCVFRAAGTLSNLYINITANTTTASNSAKVRKNAANGNQTITIASGAGGIGTFEDSSNTDTVAAGDKISYQTVSGGTGTYTIQQLSTIFDATTNTVTVHTRGNSGTITTASVTRFHALGGDPASNGTATESIVQYKVKKAGTLKNLFVFIPTSANARTTNTIFKSRKNTADGNLTVTYGNVETGLKEDTTNSDTIAVDDLINYATLTSTGTLTLTCHAFGSHFETTTNDAPCTGLWHASGSSRPANATTWFHLSGGLAASTTAELQRDQQAQAAFTFNNLQVRVANNTITAASILTFRKNAADGNLSVSITASTNGIFEDTSHSDTVVATDMINYRLVAGATGTSMDLCHMGINSNLTTSTNFDRPLSAETITISESIARLYGANRVPTAETNTIGEAIARAFVGTRALSTETNTIGEAIARVKGSIRAPTAETNTIGESLARLYGANRSLSAETTAISEAIAKVQVLVRALSVETVTVGESLARLLSKIKALSDTTAISESIARVFVGVRALSAETNTIGETLARVKGANRLLSNTTTIGESLTRLLGAIRSLSDTTVIGESLARTYNAIRALATQTVSVSEALAKVQVLVRSLSDTTIISETLTRLLAAIRSLSDTSAISDAVDRVIGVAGIAYTKALSDTVAISESLTRVYGAVRSLSNTTTITEALTRLIVAIRSLSDTTLITESLDRLQVLTRALTNTTIITDSVTALFSTGTLVRNLVETVIISEVLARAQTLTRTLTENTIITEFLEAIKAIIIPLWQRPTEPKRPEGVGPRNRSMERESESYFRKQFSRLTGRRYGISKRSRSG